MASSDLNSLVEMGFDEQKAGIALKKGGNLQGAIDWLDKNADKTIEDLKEEQDDELEEGAPKLQVGEEAKSLVCTDCGKKFRSIAQAEFHGNKTGHENFEESTEEIKPLTEEEKKARLEELRQKLALKRAGQSEQDKLDAKRNEEIKRKSTKETQDIKEDLAKKEMLKEAAAKKREKQADIDAKKRIQAKIAADKEERRLKNEREKAARAGQYTYVSEPVETPKPTAPKTAGNYTEARLRLQTPSGTIQKNFPADTTLYEVAHDVSAEVGTEITSFTQNFPRKTFDVGDFGQTLKEAGLVPSAALIAK